MPLNGSTLNLVDLRQRVAGIVVGSIVLAGIAYTTTRASDDDLDGLRQTHAEDVESIETTQQALTRTVHAVDSKLTSIAVVLDRMDRNAGGPGMPPKTLSAEPME